MSLRLLEAAEETRRVAREREVAEGVEEEERQRGRRRALSRQCFEAWRETARMENR